MLVAEEVNLIIYGKKEVISSKRYNWNLFGKDVIHILHFKIEEKGSRRGK